LNFNITQKYLIFIYSILFFLGIDLILLTYIIAYSNIFPWNLYWIGFLLCSLTSFLIIKDEYVNEKLKFIFIFIYGLVFYIIQFVGTNGYYNFRDEYLMNTITNLIYTNESLNIESILQNSNSIYLLLLRFPGMELLIVSLQKITGVLNSYPVVAFTIALIHSMLLFFIYFIIKAITSNKTLAGITAFVYTTNIDYSWYNTVYHYESISLILFFMAVYLFILRTMSKNIKNYSFYFILFVITISAITITHHLTSYILINILILFILIHIIVKKYKGYGELLFMPMNYVMLLFIIMEYINQMMQE